VKNDELKKISLEELKVLVFKKNQATKENFYLM
jgi:hypothetical protein